MSGKGFRKRIPENDRYFLYSLPLMLQPCARSSGSAAECGCVFRAGHRARPEVSAATVIDRSTYREPALAPIGIRHVLVNGVAVVSNGRIVDGVTPGQAVRAPAIRP